MLWQRALVRTLWLPLFLACVPACDLRVYVFMQLQLVLSGRRASQIGQQLSILPPAAGYLGKEDQRQGRQAIDIGRVVVTCAIFMLCAAVRTLSQVCGSMWAAMLQRMPDRCERRRIESTYRPLRPTPVANTATATRQRTSCNACAWWYVKQLRRRWLGQTMAPLGAPRRNQTTPMTIALSGIW